MVIYHPDPSVSNQNWLIIIGSNSKNKNKCSKDVRRRCCQ